MKSAIVGLCGLVLCTHAQFNLQLNQGGLRVGILGAEVANVGGQNKNKPFPNNFPFDIAQIFVPPPPQIIYVTPQYNPNQIRIENIQPNPNQIPRMSTTMTNPLLSINQQFNQMKPIPVPNQVKPTQSSTQIANKLVQKMVTSIEKQNKQSPQLEKTKEQQIKLLEVKNIQHPIKQIKDEHYIKTTQKETEILDVKQKQEKQLQEMKKKQDQRLAKFVHLLPKQQKQHLRAIAADRAQV